MRTQCSSSNKSAVFLSAIIQLHCLLALASRVGAGEPPPPPPPPPPKWETVATLGYTLSEGNSKNYLLSGLINTTKKWKHDEVLMGVGGGYGETTTQPATGPEVKTITDKYIKGYAQWNHLITERFYTGLRFDAASDAVADLDYRYTITPLVGYYVLKRTNAFCAFEAGPSYVWEKQGGVEDNYVALRFSQRAEWTFKNGSKIWDNISYLPQVEDFNNYVITVEAGIAAPITKGIDVRCVLLDTYDNQPAPGRLKNDFKLIAGIGIKF